MRKFEQSTSGRAGYDPIGARFPLLARSLNRVSLASLPTPVRHASVRVAGVEREIWLKLDNLSSSVYGGNKVRKLEYLFGRLRARNKRRVATFGAIASNHALATALHARELGIEPICFLSHQTRTQLAATALTTHLGLGTTVVRFGGARRDRIRTLREHLFDRQADVIPMGGSSWLGTIGPVAAGLELAAQIERGRLPAPHRIYIATGTMGTAAGIALGLAVAGVDETVVHAVRVSHGMIANEQVFAHLRDKTARMLNRLDPSFPLAETLRIRTELRHGQFAPGYAHSNKRTDDAVARAADQLDLDLEVTYTGKAMAALLHDLPDLHVGERVLFWNTYNSAPLPRTTSDTSARDRLPDEFLSYFD